MIRPRIALAVESPKARDRLTRYFEAATDVLPVAVGSYRDLLLGVIGEQPDVMVLELTRRSRFAGNLVSTIRRALPRTWVVVYSPRPTAADTKVLDAGVHYYSPGQSIRDLKRAVAAAVRGRHRCANGADMRKAI